MLHGNELREKDGRPEATRREKENSTEHATTAAKPGHRSSDCWSEKVTRQRQRRTEGQKIEHGYKGGYHHNNSSYKGGGKFANVYDSLSFARQL